MISYLCEPRVSINGNSIQDLLEWKKLPNIKDKRVTKARFIGAHGYQVDRGDGSYECIVGENAHQRTIQYLKELDNE